MPMPLHTRYACVRFVLHVVGPNAETGTEVGVDFHRFTNTFWKSEHFSKETLFSDILRFREPTQN